MCRPSGVWAAIYQGPLWDAALWAGGSHNCFQLGRQPEELGAAWEWGGGSKRLGQGPEGSLPARYPLCLLVWLLSLGYQPG